MSKKLMNKLKSFAFFAVLALLILGSLYFLSRPKASENSKAGGQSPLQSLEPNFDFGTISMGTGVVQHSYKVKNSSENPIEIKKIYTSCMCTEASLVHGQERHGPFGMPGHGIVPSVNETLAPGAEVEIEAVFDPAAHGPAGIGRVEREIFVETREGGQLALKFSAEVTP